MAETENTNSILQTVKDGLLIVGTFTAFDNQIVGYINAALAILSQAGYAPAKDFEVTGYDETWDDLITEPDFNLVKTFICMKVSDLFDPPSSSFAASNRKEFIEELLVRIRYKVETGSSDE